MASLYIHIPFCKRACSYCNFHFSINRKTENSMLAAIQKELLLQKNFFSTSEKIQTIYLGGGTPSIIPTSLLSALLKNIHLQYQVASNAEITLEINPDDISEQNVDDWKSIGFNRFSVGIQSFFDDDLLYLERVHKGKQCLDGLDLLQKKNIKNLSADLIFGIPTTSLKKLKYNLETLTNKGIVHISCYGLTIEPKTLLAYQIEQKRKIDINQTQQAEEFLFILNFLEKAGYEHYEISNYALPSFRSKHNSAYWQQTSYLGIGPSAHSFNGLYRQANINNNHLYMQQIEKGIVPCEIENLSPQQKYNEFVLTQLRRKEGIAFNEIKKMFPNYFNYFLKQIETIPKEQLLIFNDSISLSFEGKLFCDKITLHLFAED